MLRLKRQITITINNDRSITLSRGNEREATNDIEIERHFCAGRAALLRFLAHPRIRDSRGCRGVSIASHRDLLLERIVSAR